jgi:flagellar biosynthesis protein FliP
MAQVISLLISIFTAVPALKQLWDQIIAAYIATQINTIKEEYKAAIRKAIYEHDQRDLEQAMGSAKSGEASGISGAVIVDDIGLPPPTKG